MDELRFYLSIPAAEYLAYYRGDARTVSVVAHDGRTVEFPASRLRPYITPLGIRGEFLMRLDDDNKLIELRLLRA